MATDATSLSALSIADINSTINHEPRILDTRLAEVLGFSRPREIRPLVQRHRDALERFGEVCCTVQQTTEKGGRPARTYWLTKRQALYLCTKSETDRATEATIQMVEVFDAYLAGRVPAPASDLPDGHGTVILFGKPVRFAAGPVSLGDIVLGVNHDGSLGCGPVADLLGGDGRVWVDRAPGVPHMRVHERVTPIGRVLDADGTVRRLWAPKVPSR